MLPDNKRLLVALTGEDSVVTRRSRRTARSLGRLRTGKGAHNFWPKGDGRHWFLSNRIEGTVSLIDTQDMQVVGTVRIPGGPDCMDITPDGKELWVTQRFLRRIAIVDLATMKVVGQHPDRQVAARRLHPEARRPPTSAAGARGLERAGTEVGPRAMRDVIDLWVGVQTWLFETFVSPVLFSLNLMEWFEPAFNAVEFFMLGVVQILVILLVMRLLERRWGARARRRERLIGVDRVYTRAEQARHRAAADLRRSPTRSPTRSSIWCACWASRRRGSNGWFRACTTTRSCRSCVYFALYDFAAYWVHRAQHRFAWWWALHSLHHSQRRMTVWTDDRNHVLDDLLVNLVLAVFAQFVGVQPDDFVLILMVGRLVESWSHANVDMSFGRLGERLLVGPRFHRLHHALADAAEPHIHDHNFAPVLPIWDILFGTARFGEAQRPTGVDDPDIDADNGRGWLGQQVAVFERFAAALCRADHGRPAPLVHSRTGR